MEAGPRRLRSVTEAEGLAGQSVTYFTAGRPQKKGIARQSLFD